MNTAQRPQGTGCPKATPHTGKDFFFPIHRTDTITCHLTQSPSSPTSTSLRVNAMFCIYVPPVWFLQFHGTKVYLWSWWKLEYLFFFVLKLFITPRRLLCTAAESKADCCIVDLSIINGQQLHRIPNCHNWHNYKEELQHSPSLHFCCSCSLIHV